MIRRNSLLACFEVVIAYLILNLQVLVAQVPWSEPRTDRVSRSNRSFRLINYAHRHDLLRNVQKLEEKLAQWNVIIVHPDHGMSIETIRKTNPAIKILVWIPLQGPGKDSLSKGFQEKWWGKDANGKVKLAHWGGRIANPSADEFGYTKHILSYLQQRKSDYDGVMFDCAWENAAFEIDVNQDRVFNKEDTVALKTAVNQLFQQTRKEFPKWIITGNAGGTWSEECPYWKFANGNLHENALGDQFYDSSFRDLSEGIVRMSTKAKSPRYGFHIVDLRRKRSQDEAQKAKSLTLDDARRLRLGLASCMMVDDAYFGFDRGDCLHGQLWWFKEYDANLGAAKGENRMNAFGPGLLSREFKNGTIIINTTTSEKSIKLGKPYTDASSNVTDSSFVIPAMDARILVGLSAP